MKYLSFLLPACFLFYVTTLFAQNTTTWFPPGAKWSYYSIHFAPAGDGQEFLELVGQEVVGGELCAKLHYHGFSVDWVFWPFDEGFRYFFARNDSVFLWNGNTFDLLYDFNRVVGDTFTPSSNIYDQCRVMNTGDTVWNGIPLRFQDLRLEQFPLWPGGDTFYFNTRVYERLGGTHLIYWDMEHPLIETQYYLACYSDEEYPMEDCPLGYDPTYVSFPQYSNSVWSETDGSWCDFRGYQYKVHGDTIIEGVGLGKKVYFRNTYIGMTPCPDAHVEIIHEPFQLIGLLHQDVPHKKVYFARLTIDPVAFPICMESNPLPFGEFTLLYDFDVNIGDTLFWKLPPNVVQAFDSLQLDDGSWRRSIVFDSIYPSYWIEGIGSNHGLFGSYANTLITDIGCDLQCFRFNNQLKYSRVDAIFCDSIAVDVYEPNDFDNVLRLFPNPSSGAVILEMPISETPAMLRIFDPQGRELGNLEVTDAQSQIDLAPWRGNALLFLQIRGSSGQMAGRVLRLE